MAGSALEQVHVRHAGGQVNLDEAPAAVTLDRYAGEPDRDQRLREGYGDLVSDPGHRPNLPRHRRAELNRNTAVALQRRHEVSNGGVAARVPVGWLATDQERGPGRHEQLRHTGRVGRLPPRMNSTTSCSPSAARSIEFPR